MNNIHTLEELFISSVSKYADLTVNMMAGTDIRQTYSAMGQSAERISEMLSQHGIGAGDKVAIYSAGHVNWISVFFSAVAFGRVAVPLLPDFSENEVNNIVLHSEAKAIFVSKKCYQKISENLRSTLPLIVDIETLEILADNSGSVEFAKTGHSGPNDLAVLIYTSGTTGTAKGVMLTHDNFVSMVESCYSVFRIGKDDVLLSVLPLAHAYEMSLGMLYPFSAGSSVCYLTKAPTPSVLSKTLADVRPTAMLVVPLIIEKVVNNLVLPKIRKSMVLSWMDRNMHGILLRIIGREMIKSFGGRLVFLGIGGAKLDVNVEKVLKDAHFPYYIGYGLTECAPLLSIACFKDTVPGSIGFPIKGVEMKLHNVNPETGEGEIIARGRNIMPGYYKDPERTAGVFTEDGWFRTNDLASMDKKGRYAIKGRLGNMIVGASGENIYPEEIESIFNKLSYVEDAIVISRNKKLVALVKLTDGLIDFQKIKNSDEKKKMEELRSNTADYVNSQVNTSSHIHSVEFMKEPFKKTATMKIRRFLYKDDSPSV